MGLYRVDRRSKLSRDCSQLSPVIRSPFRIYSNDQSKVGFFLHSLSPFLLLPFLSRAGMRGDNYTDCYRVKFSIFIETISRDLIIINTCTVISRHVDQSCTSPGSLTPLECRPRALQCSDPGFLGHCVGPKPWLGQIRIRLTPEGNRPARNLAIAMPHKGG